MLTFQKMDVYRRAVDFNNLAIAVTEALPRGNADTRDQLRRASSSIILNISEAAGRSSRADAARHYSIARGSAQECAGALDLVRGLKAIDDTDYQRGVELLTRLVMMLSKLCR